jgi:hypothetical protein
MAEGSSHLHHASEQTRRKARLTDYIPLAVLIGVSIVAALAISAGYGGAIGMPMHAYMGFSLCAFAMLKLFDLPRFADGFAMYDLVAMRARLWGFVYPFIELGLGLAYFAYFMPPQVYVVTIVLFGLNFIGVIAALDRGVDVDCACMGASLRVPLSTVTAAEDVIMVLMASVMLAM